MGSSFMRFLLSPLLKTIQSAVVIIDYESPLTGDVYLFSSAENYSEKSGTILNML